MLKLEKLELRGFKSFGEEIEITFPGAITAIVGPNGCGKSNIADGILWVLGEQSARSLRGSRMEDVIFQGSRTRPAVGMTEVVLTLSATADIDVSRNRADSDDGDETDDRAPWYRARKIHAGEVITVARRLYRSGTSEYFIDGRHVRLRDIYDLFAGTGLGPGHYAIIGQDQINELVSAKPSQRRAIIEEAAGITRFKLRQRAIELRLESTRQNLTRINDIIVEVERQVASLRRQAARARRYRRMREELRALLRILYRQEYRRLTEELTTVTAHIETLEQEKSRLSEEISRLEAHQRSLMEQSRQQETGVGEARERLAQVELEIERVTSRRAQVEHRQGELARRRHELDSEEAALTERLELISRERARLEAERDRLDAELADGERRLTQAESAHAALLAEARACEDAMEKLRVRFVEQVNATAMVRNARHQIEEGLRRLELRLKNLAGEQERARERRAQLLEEHQQIEREKKECGRHHAALLAHHEEIQRRLAEARAAEAAERNDLAESERRRIACENRLRTLRELEERYAYYSEAVQWVFHLPEARTELHLLGTLADVVQVEPQWERMVEALLGERLQAILVPSLEDARRAADVLDGAGVGRVQFLVVGIGGGRDGARPKSSLADDGPPATSDISFVRFLGLDPAVEAAFLRAYPEYESAVVVADRDAAIERSLGDPHRLVVTFEGEWMRGGCVLSTGTDGGRTFGLLSVKREIRELTASLEGLLEESAQRERRLADRVAEIESLEHELESCQAALREQERVIFEKDVRQSDISREIDRVEQQLRVVAFEVEQAEREQTKARHEHAQLESEVARSEEGLRRLESENQHAQTHIAALREKIAQVAERLSLLKVERASATERKQALVEQLRQLDREGADCHHRRERIAGERYQLLAEQDALARTLDELQQESARRMAERSRLEREVTDALAHLGDVHRSSDRVQEQLAELRHKHACVQEQLSSAEIRRATLESQAEFLKGRCFAELAQTLEDVLSRPDDAEVVPSTLDVREPQTLRERIDALRQRLEEAGPVNMMALDELQQAQERYDFLRRQREDIEASLASTEQALVEIRRRSRHRFIEAFRAINENFTAMFQELFGGGQGEMVLLDPDNVLDSGVDIIAQPPGKRLQNIQLLSGGEKALTALALLLAIFRYRPSPFCVLDEVDASLDDVNVTRFSRKIVEMSQHTQFILITHNKETMEVAHVLYGITMEEPGVSKLVSVRLQ